MSNADDWSLYLYNPTKVAPVIFAVICTLAGVLHGWQGHHYSFLRLSFLMGWGCLVWVAGFVVREISINQVQNIPLFVAQYVLILAGPPIVAAAELFFLGRLLEYIPYHSPMDPRRVTSTFLALSTCVEVLTANGASRAAAADATTSDVNMGRSLIKAALIIQAVIEISFMSITILVQYRCWRANKWPHHVRVVGRILVATSALILWRCIFRIVDVFDATPCDPSTKLVCGDADRHEWMLWVFEISVVTAYILILNVFHPGRYLASNRKIFLDPVDGVTERLGPGWQDSRPWWMTIIDPFNLSTIFRKKDTVRKFWLEEHPAVRVVSDGGSNNDNESRHYARDLKRGATIQENIQEAV